jgi:translation initiation factor IF-3
MRWAGHCRWNIAPHDFAVKARKLEEFLEQGKTVSVAVTYDHRPKTWQEQYPKAVEVWCHSQNARHTWQARVKAPRVLFPAVNVADTPFLVWSV